MRVLTKSEVFAYKKDIDILDSLSLLAKDTKNELLSTEQRNEWANWINKINRLHHSDGKFFENFKNMFSIDNQHQVLEGQEDVAGIEHKNLIFIIRQAEMGVAFGVRNKDGSPIKKENVKDVEEAISMLDIGFGNAKNFQSQILFDTINDEVNNQNNKKQKTVKL